MPDLSIRQFAKKLNVSHTAVRNAIADLESETGNNIGVCQGQGLAKMLDEREQTLIAQKFYEPATSASESTAKPAPREIATIHAGITYGIPGLARRTAPVMQLRSDEIVDAKYQYQATGQQAVSDMAYLVQRYASFKAVETIQEIDAVFEGVKASALNQSVEVLGKPQEVEPIDPV